MSLLDGPDPAHAPAVKRLKARLRAGNEEARAVLLNLIEEDRVPHTARAAFHAALARATHRLARRRFQEATWASPMALPVPTPRPAAIQGTWWHHVTLASLQKFNYFTLAVRPASPPPRLPLARPMGRAQNGANRSLWITTTTGPNADDLRDRLGLGGMMRDDQLYRVRMGVGVAPLRPLYIPTALDAGWYPAWRRPAPSHAAPWGMTRHLQTDAPSEPELLTLPHMADAQEAGYVGRIGTDPPRGYLRARGLP
jgi:hypothetical protein